MSDLTTALEALPHGPEFRFLDALMELEPGRRARGRYRLRGDEPFLRGHFPGTPLMPGVLLVEAAAQLAGAVAQSDAGLLPLPGLKLAAIRQAKFLSPVLPGDEVILEAEILGQVGRLVQAAVSAAVGERPVLQVELTLAGDESPTGG